MATKEENLALVKNLIRFYKTKHAFIFSNKCKTFEPIFYGIQKVLEDLEEPNRESEKYNQRNAQIDNEALYAKDCDKYNKELSSLKESLSTFLSLLEKLESEQFSTEFLESDKPIKTFLSEIDSMNKNIFKNMERLCYTSFNLPSYNIYDDIKQIESILSKHQDNQSIQKRHTEIDNYHKKINHPYIEIMNELGQNYQLKPEDYSKTNKISDNNSYEYYEGELRSNQKKVIITKLKDRENFRTLFPILAKIKNDSIETFIGATFTDSTIELVTEKKDHSLKNLIENKNISLTLITYKIAQVMSYLHSQMIVFRDLNLSHIFVDKIDDKDPTKAIPIITDFSSAISLTNSSFLGLPNFIPSQIFCAPELTSSHTYDEKVDVFAFGAILYEIITGNHPYNDLDRKEIERHLVDGERPELPSDCPQNLIELIKKCWCQEPASRLSFDQVLVKMSSEQVILPSDSDKVVIINDFYQKISVKNDVVYDCLNNIELTNTKIRYSKHFKYELHRARIILKNYKYLLRNSKYTIEKLNDSEKEIIKNLNQSLKSFLEVVNYVQVFDISILIQTYGTFYITDELNKMMSEAYKSMTSLGFKVDEYHEDKDDLRFDYFELKRNLMYLFCEDERISYENGIDKYMKKKKLRNILSNEDIYSRLQVIFSPFKSREVDRGNFYYINNFIKGDGYESNVYKGIMIKDQNEFSFEEVAIKIIRQEYFIETRNLINLRREIGYLTYLNHEFIQDFIGFSISKEGDQVWIITKYIEGKDLYEAKNDMDAYQKTKVAFEMAVGMRYLHKNRIIHRDLKPSNIMVTKDGVTKIIDFGYSSCDIKSIYKSTQIGTSFYMSPEIIQYDKYGKSSDVFSFSMSLWELYSGYHPYTFKDGVDPYGKIRDDDFMSPNEAVFKISAGKRPNFDDDCPLPLKMLIVICWDQDPNERPSFKEIIKMMIEHKISYLTDDDEDHDELERKIDDFYESVKNIQY